MCVPMRAIGRVAIVPWALVQPEVAPPPSPPLLQAMRAKGRAAVNSTVIWVRIVSLSGGVWGLPRGRAVEGSALLDVAEVSGAGRRRLLQQRPLRVDLVDVAE